MKVKKHLYRVSLCTVIGFACVVAYGWFTDCPNTQNYVSCVEVTQ